MRSTGTNMFSLGRGGGIIAGKTIEAAGLRGLADAFLVAIERGNTTLHAVAPTEVLMPGDILWFAGSTEGVISLRKIPGMPLRHCICAVSVHEHFMSRPESFIHLCELYHEKMT